MAKKLRPSLVAGPVLFLVGLIGLGVGFFVFKPPHKPLSVVTRIAPTRFTLSRLTRNGCLYSVLALATCIAISSARKTYGRVARMRSWAFFIFAAATISIALVILRVLCTLRILLRISFEPAMAKRG